MRRAAKVDDNHAEIVAFFRSFPGCAVLDLSRVGGGCPDLLVHFGAENHLVEVKDGAKPPSKRKLTPEQSAFFGRWPGPVHIVESTEDVVALLSGESK